MNSNNSNNSEIANAIKIIESVAPDGYGRMLIPSETDSELYQQIEFALQSDSRADFLLNQHGVNNLFKFVERMATHCLRETEFLPCSHAAEALELLLWQPEYDEHMILVALALTHDAYERLPEPQPEFDGKRLPRFSKAWDHFFSDLDHHKSISSVHFRIGEERDGPRYICYW
ncbi:hypothetical protein [uncultured Gimesia sp.]|uniref:hypothetical protein n=1 Tax=uncultured Gimesia sp. TaxID=1678688 RepID=UPI0030D8CD66|tara:strand:- start:54626 stop:55144 length:519 start_codon:yes stop_codon:yes gene_type:complete